MKKQFLFLLTCLFMSQFALADGAVDVQSDTLGKCDEQYFSVIKLKIKRPEAVPFTVNAQGGKVEFSTGNLLYQAKTNTFRFATRQWQFVGNATDTNSSYDVLWDSIAPKQVTENGVTKTVYDTFQVRSNNLYVGPKYRGWIDGFGWATSGYNPNASNEPDRNDPYNTCTKPYSTSSNTVNATYNNYGYGPSINNAGLTDGTTIAPNIDTADAISRKYDWGYYNDIYCKWVGFDTTKATGNTGKDSIVFDSTMFNAKIWRTLTSAEWTYVVLTRKVENKTKAAYAKIILQTAAGTEFPGNGGADPLGAKTSVRGMLLFPDDFELAVARKVGFPAEERDSIEYGGTKAHKLSYKAFEALEKLGVIFLPSGYWANAARTTGAGGANSVTDQGYYWSATQTAVGTASGIALGNNAAPSIHNGNRYYPRYVRLVRDLVYENDRYASIYQ